MNKKYNYNSILNIKKLATRRNSIISILLMTTMILVSLSLTSINSLSAKEPQVLESGPQFNLDATYAYVGQGPQNDTFTDSTGTVFSPISQYPSAIYFNITRSTIENITCDVILEVYNVTISSDKGPAEIFIFFTGTNYNPSFSETELDKLTNYIYDLFDVNTVDGVNGHFRFNWTDNEPLLSTKVGSFGTYTNYKNGTGLWSAGQPNSISVTFHRIGCVSMTNGVVAIQPDTQSINCKKQVQLQEHNDGFLKNNLLSADELSQNNRF